MQDLLSKEKRSREDAQESLFRLLQDVNDKLLSDISVLFFNFKFRKNENSEKKMMNIWLDFLKMH